MIFHMWIYLQIRIVLVKLQTYHNKNHIIVTDAFDN